MTSLQLDHVTNVYGFISTSIRLLTTKLGRILTCKNKRRAQLGHVINVYGFIFTSMSPDDNVIDDDAITTELRG